MTKELNTQQESPVLEIRNQGLAVFAAIQLNQIPDIKLKDNHRVVFVFKTEMEYEQLNLQWKNSIVHKAHELAISFSGVRKKLLNNRT